MRKTLLSSILVALFLIVAPLAAAQSPRANESKVDDNTQILKALLEETRQMRLELQRANSFSQRLVVAVERIRVEQNHVDSLNRSLDEVQRQLAEIAGRRSLTEYSIKDNDDHINDASAETRATLESANKILKAQLETLTTEEAHARQREASLNGDIESSKNNLAELNNKIDLIMSELDKGRERP